MNEVRKEGRKAMHFPLSFLWMLDGKSLFADPDYDYINTHHKFSLLPYRETYT